MGKGQKRNWDQVGEIVAKIKELGLNYTEGAKHFGLSVWTIYEYNKRLKVQSQVPTDEEKVAVESPPGQSEGMNALPTAIRDLIVEYRRSHPDHGFRRIEDELKQKHLLAVSRKQIRAVLKEAGLLEALDSSFDRESKPLKGTRRFEASYPGELWQMDVKYVYISGVPAKYLAVIVDDHSRFCTAAQLCEDQRAETLIAVLHDACVRHGRPRKLLTDQGTAFYTWSLGQTRFQQYLDDHRIEHIVSNPHSPTTQGKVERLIQTIDRELLSKVRFTSFEDGREKIHQYIHGYNFARPHQGLAGRSPCDRFYGVAAETARAESSLLSRNIDLSRGYMICKVQDRQVSVVHCAEGLQVFLDGKLLREANCDDVEH